MSFRGWRRRSYIGRKGFSFNEGGGPINFAFFFRSGRKGRPFFYLAIQKPKQQGYWRFVFNGNREHRLPTVWPRQTGG